MKRRVVVTGLGAITSLGTEVNAIWESLLSKKSGIDKISRFDATGYRSQIASEVKNFDQIGRAHV